MQRIVVGLVVVVVAVLALLYVAGQGVFGDATFGGEPKARAIAADVVEARAEAVRLAGEDLGIARPKQILFGDLHVHSTFSFDAFQLSLPMAGGDGAHPVADACDYARHCSGLDFWSISDHGITLTPRAWGETVDAIRQCNAVAGDTDNPDHVAYLGWEWTQVGTTPENHWGHKNVVLRDLADDAIPTRPISAGTPPGTGDISDFQVSPLLLGALSLGAHASGGSDFVRFMNETMGIPWCPDGVPVRELPDDCREAAPTPGLLFEKLDDWNLASMVIPHGTTWGFYTPAGSSWEKQLTREQHDPDRQRIIEVFSGHGNSEEYRDFREVEFSADGAPTCPAPTPDFLPSCWRAGEIIAARCLDEGEAADECEARAAEARRIYLETDFNGGFVTVGKTEIVDWQDAGQCRDCFQPAFNYRPKSSVQYIMSLENPEAVGGERFRFGFIASSDNHSARPGTGYKEVARTEFTEARFGTFVDTPVGTPEVRPPESRARSWEMGPGDTPFAGFETERGASFFLNGGLAAVHATGRDRDSIWNALERKEVYGTSGPRILLWFDLLNGPKGPTPMGSEALLSEAPIFQVRAQGSFEQKPGCPADALDALGDRVDRLCQGECYHPGDARRPITRIEVVRIRPGSGDAGDRIEDPWKVLPCPADGGGCRKAFIDPDFVGSGRDTLYYVRAIEAPSPAVGADPLGCTRDAEGRCVDVNPCFGRPAEDECLAETEERAWSSPIFVDQAKPRRVAATN